MHKFQQECEEFDRTAGTSQNTKITPCFLYFLDFYKNITYIFYSFRHISINLCNPNSTKNMFYYRQFIFDTQNGLRHRANTFDHSLYQRDAIKQSLKPR